MSTPENFIPWEQIEPLLKDGMTGRELKAALCARLGLDPERYFFRFPGSFFFERLADVLKRGCLVLPGRSATPSSLDEPVR